MSKFADKFLSILKLNDDYDEYDDYDDYDDEEDEVPAKKFSKASRDSSYSEEKTAREVADIEPAKPSKSFSKSSKVVPMRTGRTGMEVCVIKPKNVEEAREITDTLLSGRAVILNLEGLHVDVAQRIIDFTSGSCYSINGNLQKVSNYIFIITPETVDISGDFQDLLDGGFDVAAFK